MGEFSLLPQAVDAVQGSTGSQFTLLHNRAKQAVQGLTFRVATWVGGLTSAGRATAGRFK